ncbi:MAG: hypothetical protein Q8R30_02345 [bacterium]|nr:hypothetical protein [bacterium]MDZ4286073.1 hypothetical protein [Candidatus Sungbacteria bacterium]
MLKERQQIILEAVIREYIQTARPISSAELLEDLDLDISPATVRSEMLKLDELGYLEQPHTSAGRVPTDRGYRFFVDHAVNDALLNRSERDRIRELFTHDTIEDFARECSRTIADITRAFTSIGTDDDVLTDRGFTEILDEPEFQDINHVKQFGKLMDMLDEDMQSLMEVEGERILIGGENPMKEARPYTMMITHWTHPKGFKGFLTIVGPRRMDYQKNISLIRYINSL